MHPLLLFPVCFFTRKTFIYYHRIFRYGLDHRNHPELTLAHVYVTFNFDFLEGISKIYLPCSTSVTSEIFSPHHVKGGKRKAVPCPEPSRRPRQQRVELKSAFVDVLHPFQGTGYFCKWSHTHLIQPAWQVLGVFSHQGGPSKLEQELLGLVSLQGRRDGPCLLALALRKWEELGGSAAGQGCSCLPSSSASLIRCCNSFGVFLSFFVFNFKFQSTL